MKKWLTLSLALVTAAVTQAVTIAWTVPNSTETTGSGETSTTASWVDEVSSAYFVYSETALVNTNNENLYTRCNALVNSLPNIAEKGEASFTRDLIADTNEHGAWGTIDMAPAVGFYYLVVQNAKSEYAVAGLEITEADMADYGADRISKGVYDTSAGSAPELGSYYDMVSWLGGTWEATGATPEPTVLALLALGVAGVALRRKKNFTK